MPVFVRTNYMGQESWYKVQYGAYRDDVPCLPVPEEIYGNYNFYLRNFNGGFMEFSYQHREIDCVEASDFCWLNWRGTIFDNPNAKHGWLDTKGKFWGHDYGLELETAEFVFKRHVTEEASKMFIGCLGESFYQVLRSGFIHITGRKNGEITQIEADDIPPYITYTQAQKDWLVKNGASQSDIEWISDPYRSRIDRTR